MNNKIANIRKNIFKYLSAATLIMSALLILFFLLISVSCTRVLPENSELPEVLAAESFLADITANISGNRLKVDSLIPAGLDPHGFEPTPADVIKISQCDILIINGAGFEEWLKPVITDSMEDIVIVEASKGLKSRTEIESPMENEKKQENFSEDADEHDEAGHAIDENDEAVHDDIAHNEETENDYGHSEEKHSTDKHAHEKDSHFWLNPYLVITYVNNIRDALIDADPAAKDFYIKNAEEYTKKLLILDSWIMEEVKKIPEDKRLLITNHESFGYYADRYGFKIIGGIIPSSSTASSPSAREVAELIDKINTLNIKAIFLETGSDPKIANQIADETGVDIITELYTHSLTGPDGDAPAYIDMIRYNTIKIVESLK
ncbi:MAG: hypothetical protein FJW56_06265 [Actinobacteria bacterium]|nr:hypothetical protein [Actinomycetota bacterium]